MASRPRGTPARLWDWSSRNTAREAFGSDGLSASARSAVSSATVATSPRRRTRNAWVSAAARAAVGSDTSPARRLRPSAAVALAFEAASEAVDVRLTNHAAAFQSSSVMFAHSSSDSNSTRSLTKAYALERTLTPLSA